MINISAVTGCANRAEYIAYLIYTYLPTLILYRYRVMLGNGKDIPIQSLRSLVD